MTVTMTMSFFRTLTQQFHTPQLCFLGAMICPLSHTKWGNNCDVGNSQNPITHNNLLTAANSFCVPNTELHTFMVNLLKNTDVRWYICWDLEMADHLDCFSGWLSVLREDTHTHRSSESEKHQFLMTSSLQWIIKKTEESVDWWNIYIHHCTQPWLCVMYFVCVQKSEESVCVCVCEYNMH